MLPYSTVLYSTLFYSKFFRVLLGGDCTCHEGYGMTETTGATCVTFPDDLSLGHVGGPFPCCEIKLVDVPEMLYLHTDRMHDGRIPCEGRGEIWVRGPGVIKGYYKDEEETEAAGLNTIGGWLKSGDIGKNKEEDVYDIFPPCASQFFDLTFPSPTLLYSFLVLSPHHNYIRFRKGLHFLYVFLYLYFTVFVHDFR